MVLSDTKGTDMENQPNTVAVMPIDKYKELIIRLREESTMCPSTFGKEGCPLFDDEEATCTMCWHNYLQSYFTYI